MGSKSEELEFIKNLAKKSKLTQKDANEIAKKINMGLARRYKVM